MNKGVSGILRQLILRGGSEYTVAGLWSGGVIAVIHPADSPPSVFFQAGELSSYDQGSANLTAGLSVRAHEISISGKNQPGLLLEVETGKPLDPYFSLVDYLFEKLSFEVDQPNSWKTIFGVIEDWMEFWKVRRKTSLREQILGLVGELLTITQLLSHDRLNFEVWQGPLGGNHDFQKSGNSLEVKVCGSRSGPLVHRIASQRQFDSTENENLYLHSLRIQLGPNFADSVVELIGQAEASTLFSNPEGLLYFRKSLDLVLDPTQSPYIPNEFSTYDVLESHLLKVEENFPRIESSGLMQGVIDVRYAIDLTTYVSEQTAVAGRRFDLIEGKLVNSV